MLIDFHTHCFPDKIAARAIEKLADASGGIENYADGTVEGLKNRLAQDGVDAAVVLNIATNARQQKSVNDFAAQINDEKTIFAFGSVYPDSPDALDELDRIKELGLKGVKLHPDYQGFFVDDPKWKPLYKKISSLGLITVFHAGMDYGYAPPYGGMPEAMARAIEWFDSPVVAAHWGGINCNEDVLKHLCGKNVYFDVSMGYNMMPKAYAAMILEKHGPEKLLFGTDSPWRCAPQEMRLLKSLGISGAEMEMISSGNAKKLLGIE